MLIGSYYSPFVGGIESHMAQLAAALKRNGAEVTVTCLVQHPPGRMARGVRETIDGIAVNRVVSRGVGESFRWPGQLVPQGSADLVHFHGFSRPLALRCWLDTRHCPTVFTLHGGVRGVFTDHNRIRRALKHEFDITLGRTILNRASRIIAVTDVEAEHLQRVIGIRRSRIRVMSNPLESDAMRLNDSQQGESGRLLVLSRLVPDKKVDDLIRALAIMPLPVGCDIAGPDEGDRLRLERLAKQLAATTVKFVGPVFGEQKRRMLRQARALVLPSLSEGLSISALEAIAQGTPVIASDMASIGLPAAACLKFPVGDVAALAACIESLDDTKVLASLQIGLSRARKEIRLIDDYATEVVQIYAEALAASN